MKQILQAFARLKIELKRCIYSVALVSFSVFNAIGSPPRPSYNSLSPDKFQYWGFFAHQRINRLAVYTLPPEMLGFYKKNIDYLTENAVNADRRRYAVQAEAPRHFIDLDNYSDSVRKQLPSYSWKEAVTKIGEDSLHAHGIVPWHIVAMKYRLTGAFRKKDIRQILSLSADMGHYIADANVPLHTTRNYNGQLTNQIGIHAFWESRLPELFADRYDFFLGQANYEEYPDKRAWQAVMQANMVLDSVLTFERELTAEFSEDKKYSFEEINNVTKRVYSRAFSTRYHQMLNNQVERQMRASIKMIGDFWFTCWVDAGQPDLNPLKKYEPSQTEENEEKDERRSWLKRIFDARKEDDN